MVKRKRNSNKKYRQSNFAKLSVFQPQKYKIIKKIWFRKWKNITFKNYISKSKKTERIISVN